MPGRVFARKKRRIPCVVLFESGRYSGMVIDMSPSGLFIQTSAKARLGDVLDLKLSIPGEISAVDVHAEVVRVKSVPARLRMVDHGGLGVRVLVAPETYYRFMELLKIGRDTGT